MNENKEFWIKRSIKELKLYHYYYRKKFPFILLPHFPLNSSSKNFEKEILNSVPLDSLCEQFQDYFKKICTNTLLMSTGFLNCLQNDFFFKTKSFLNFHKYMSSHSVKQKKMKKKFDKLKDWSKILKKLEILKRALTKLVENLEREIKLDFHKQKLKQIVKRIKFIEKVKLSKSKYQKIYLIYQKILRSLMDANSAIELIHLNFYDLEENYGQSKGFLDIFKMTESNYSLIEIPNHLLNKFILLERQVFLMSQNILEDIKTASIIFNKIYIQ